MSEAKMPTMPKGAPSLAEILIQTKDMPWREKSLKGVHEKMLWRDEATGATISLNKFEKGAGIPKPHSHACRSGVRTVSLTTGFQPRTFIFVFTSAHLRCSAGARCDTSAQRGGPTGGFGSVTRRSLPHSLPVR